MKKLLLLLGLAALLLPVVSAQQPPIIPPSDRVATAARALTKFNLDFSGGTPGELVAAIQKAMGRPLNVVIPVEHANWKLPPLKMTGINVMQLFNALEMAGPRRQVINGIPSDTAYGFRTNQPAQLDDDSIWTFYAHTNGGFAGPKIARFYLLTPYVEAGLTVDDITTAIQTSWRMLDDKDPPTLSFHKETKMLIAVGEPRGLETIDAALATLDAIRTKSPAPDKPGAEKKTKS